VEQAKADGWDGRLRVVLTDVPESQNLGIALQSLLGQAGIDLTLDVGTNAQLIEKVIINADYDLAQWSVGLTLDAPWAGLGSFESDAALNYTGIQSADLDAAIDGVRAARSQAEL